MMRWIPVAEEFPPVGVLVIVGRATSCVERNEPPFVGYIPLSAANGPLLWVRVRCIGHATDESHAGEVRATDFWLPVPQWEPDGVVLPGGWPA